MPSKRSDLGRPAASKESQIRPDRNQQRRAKYSDVPGVADAARADSREAYRKGKPREGGPQRLPNGLFSVGVQREVTYEDAEQPETRETFTIPEFAVALGKSELTVRRWIEADKLPPPYLRDLARGYRVYSLGEAQVIATVLQRRESEYTYLTSTDHTAIAEMHEHVHAYRSHNI